MTAPLTLVSCAAILCCMSASSLSISAVLSLCKLVLQRRKVDKG
jgi:hypothetical protein